MEVEVGAGVGGEGWAWAYFFGRVDGVGWVVGDLGSKANLNSTQVVVEFEVCVELGKKPYKKSQLQVHSSPESRSANPPPHS